jgi:hypothetical protein
MGFLREKDILNTNVSINPGTNMRTDPASCAAADVNAMQWSIIFPWSNRLINEKCPALGRPGLIGV